MSAARIRQLLDDDDPDKTRQAVELIRALGAPALFSLALEGTTLHDGDLRPGPHLSTSDPTASLTFALQLLSDAPAQAALDPSLRPITHLALTDQDLRHLPDAPLLERLVWLDLSHNPLGALPERIGRLQALRGLSLTNTGLSALPDSLGRLSRLQALYLDSNALRGLPAALAGLAGLEDAFLHGNGLTDIDVIAQWPRLRCLVASHNQITHLPDEVPAWRRMELLDLGANPLARLPAWLGDLERLGHLGLARTGIEDVPESLGALSRLSVLDLRDNPIQFLPTTLLDDLPGLQLLDLRGTELSTDQIEVLRRHRRRSPLRIRGGT